MKWALGAAQPAPFPVPHRSANQRSVCGPRVKKFPVRRNFPPAGRETERQGEFLSWQGRLDSNQRMRESKSLALPLGYVPMCGKSAGTGEMPRSPACVGWEMGLEPTTPGTTIRCSNQLSYTHHISKVSSPSDGPPRRRWYARRDSNPWPTA